MESRNDKINKMIMHAYDTVPFYKKVYDGMGKQAIKIENLPIINKQQMIYSRESMLSSKYIGKYIRKNLNWTRTSGTSGLQYEVFWDKEDEKKSLKGLWMLRWKFYGILPEDKLCYFYASDNDEDDFFRDKTKLIVPRKTLYDGSLAEKYKEIKDFAPKWMILQPSIAIILCNLAEKYGVWNELEYIESTGEYLTDVARRRIENTFKCKVVNQYGTKELNTIAYECPSGNLHIMSDNVYVENCGNNICVTSLNNYAMPYVRYKLDDIGIIKSETKCKCGLCGEQLELKECRSMDYIQCKNGDIKHAYTLIQLIHKINYHYDGCILQYRIIQTGYDKFVYEIVLDDDLYSDNIPEIISTVLLDKTRKRISEDCIIDINFTEVLLPEEKSIKFRTFHSLVKNI